MNVFTKNSAVSKGSIYTLRFRFKLLMSDAKIAKHGQYSNWTNESMENL